MAFCDSIKLEKGMYNVGGQSFTKVLEHMDPSENYKGTELEGLDAYQRQLKRFDIKVSGPGCDTIEKFFSTTDSAVLFPEFLARAVKQGLRGSEILPSIVAATTTIDGIDYRALTSATDAGSAGVAEATAMRGVNVRTKSKLVSLIKHGRLFNSSYEALRFQNLDVVAVILKQIGADIAAEQLKDAIDALMLGDGTTPDKAEIITGGTTITYAELLKLWQGLQPYKLNTMMASVTTMKTILNLPEMKDATAGLDFQGTGKIVTPMGAKLIPAPSMDDDTILGFDKDFALQMIQSGDIIIDYDKVIDRQLDRAGISVTTGFARIFKDAVKVLEF